MKYLQAAWTNIQKKFESTPPPTLLHKDLDLILQVARDILSDQTYVYLIDNKEVYKNVIEFIEGISPELKDFALLPQSRSTPLLHNPIVVEPAQPDRCSLVKSAPV